MSLRSWRGRFFSHEIYLQAITMNRIAAPIMNGMQNFAKKVILKVSQFTFNQHHDATSVNASRTYQTTLATEHTFVHLLVCSLIFTSAHQRMYLAEIKLRKIACRTRCCTRSATYARLQFGHLADDLVALAQIVTVQIYGSRSAYRKSEVYHLFTFLLTNLL